MEVTKKRILIIEDEKPMAHALELKLTHIGFAAQAVFNGEEGIALLQKQPFDFVLLDLVMPKMDGFRVLQEMQKMNLKVPVVVLSNLGQEEDAKKAKQLGAREFFVKSNTTVAKIVEYIEGVFQGQ